MPPAGDIVPASALHWRGELALECRLMTVGRRTCSSPWCGTGLSVELPRRSRISLAKQFVARL